MLLTQMEGPEILTQKTNTLNLETVPTELRCQDCQCTMRLRREDHASETDSATAARRKQYDSLKATYRRQQKQETELQGELSGAI